MRSIFKTIVLTVGLAIGWAGSAIAAPVELLFDFIGGFNASFNGDPNAETGQLTFSVLLDNTTQDQDMANENRGRFAVDSVSLTAPGLGLNKELVSAPSPLFVDIFRTGLTIIGPGLNLDLANTDIGWNRGPVAPEDFMTDVNDLTTLPLPFSTVMMSSFFLRELTFMNGNTLSAIIGDFGPEGVFSAELANGVSHIPLPAALPLFAGGLGLMGLLGWRKKQAATA